MEIYKRRFPNKSEILRVLLLLLGGSLILLGAYRLASQGKVDEI